MHEGHDDISLIRRYVDGELTPDESRGFEALLDGDARLAGLVASERALRSHVGTILGDVRCPDIVAQRVRRSLAEAEAVSDDETDRPDVVTAPSPFRANFFAVAATLILVAGAVLWGIFGRSIDQMATRADLVAEAATFVSGEHERCAGDFDALRKASITDPDRLRAFLRNEVGIEVPIFDLRDLGFVFQGGGPCMVPGHPRSGHLIYAHAEADGAEAPLVSIFVVPDESQFDLDPDHQPTPGEWYEIMGLPADARLVLRSTDGLVMYFLVCSREADLDGVVLRISQTIAPADSVR